MFSRNLPRWLKDIPKIRETLRAASLVVPIAMFLAGLNAVYALFQSKIVWGGVRYEILSATESRVLGRDHRKRVKPRRRAEEDRFKYLRVHKFI